MRDNSDPRSEQVVDLAASCMRLVRLVVTACSVTMPVALIAVPGKSTAQRRCMFCGRAKGDLVDPSDPTSQAVIMTREHIFRSSWKDKIVTSVLPKNEPMGERAFTKYGRDFEAKLSRPESLFEVVAKPVCDYCNNGWMNDLDSSVEPWLLDPYADESQCDPTVFRRWAIKVAVLRSHHEHVSVPQPGDFSALYEGRDIPDWHIFIGRTMYPEHSHTFGGVGPIRFGSGRVMGLTQVSWSLGNIAVVAIRVVEDSETGTGYFKMFKHSIRWEGGLMAEVLPTASRLPALALLPELTPIKWDSLVWYFSPNPLSPIAEMIREAIQGYQNVLEQHGQTIRDI
ncbi:hypothetical protein ACTWP6_05025 [Mycobacterium sp. 4D054]|uniref:hypothetical protein n=1 Tax=Mycobacterium sp. 4D054 TaxID=3457440 RepID=UPI003FD22F7F